MEKRTETAKRRNMQAGVTRKIAVALAERGMKWKDVAWIIGASGATVSKKKNEHSWTLKDLVALSRTLCVTLDIGGENA